MSTYGYALIEVLCEIIQNVSQQNESERKLSPNAESSFWDILFSTILLQYTISFRFDFLFRILIFKPDSSWFFLMVTLILRVCIVTELKSENTLKTWFCVRWAPVHSSFIVKSKDNFMNNTQCKPYNVRHLMI